MLGQVLATEFLKLRRSKITWLSWLAFSIMPLADGLFMWIVKEPQRAAQLGLTGQKAQFVGAAADWPSYFTLLDQAAGAGGMVLLSIIAAYVFGATGWGKWFPWSIVPMLAGLAGPRVEVIAPGSLAVVGLTFVAGVAASIWQLRHADNTQ